MAFFLLLIVFDSAASKEMLQKAAAFFGQYTGSHVYYVIQPFIIDDVVKALDGTGLGIVAAIDKLFYPCQNQGPGAHWARL